MYTNISRSRPTFSIYSDLTQSKCLFFSIHTQSALALNFKVVFSFLACKLHGYQALINYNKKILPMLKPICFKIASNRIFLFSFPPPFFSLFFYLGWGWGLVLGLGSNVYPTKTYISGQSIGHIKCGAIKCSALFNNAFMRHGIFFLQGNIIKVVLLS